MPNEPTRPDLSDAGLNELLETAAVRARQAALHEGMGLRVGGDFSMDWYLDYSNFVIEGAPRAALDFVVRLCQAADDETLCWVGVTFVEPLLDIHWRTIAEDFERIAMRTPNLRRALSCAWLDLKPRRQGHPIANRLYGLIEEGEDIGNRSREG